MRAAPAFQVSLLRFGVWRGAVFCVCALDVAVTVAWLIARETPLLSTTCALSLSASAALTASGLLAANPQAVDLRWDGRAWHLGPAAGEPVAGKLSVAIDLGPWMLLRFAPALPQTHATWLPVQRRGLESQWHALRCAVYSPRPAPTDEPPVAF
jgi:hypothetical protein